VLFLYRTEAVTLICVAFVCRSLYLSDRRLASVSVDLCCRLSYTIIMLLLLLLLTLILIITRGTQRAQTSADDCHVLFLAVLRNRTSK